jgi:hypothetical protein
VEDDKELVRFMRGSVAADKALKKVWTRDRDYAEDVVFNVDDAAVFLELGVDEAHSTAVDHGVAVSEKHKSMNDVLVTAHVTNTAEYPICGIGLWVHNLHKASSFFSLLPVMDKEGKRTDVALLPTLNSTLPAGKTHHFSVIIEGMVDGYPNMAVVTASTECSDASVAEWDLAAGAAAAGAEAGAADPL